MNAAERKAVVLAMEILARNVNDEEVFEGWLMCGVADGDINYPSLSVDDVDEYYIQNEAFGELMGTFLRLMAGAKDSGGLYCDGIKSEDS